MFNNNIPRLNQLNKSIFILAKILQRFSPKTYIILNVHDIVSFGEKTSLFFFFLFCFVLFCFVFLFVFVCFCFCLFVLFCFLFVCLFVCFVLFCFVSFFVSLGYDMPVHYAGQISFFFKCYLPTGSLHKLPWLCADRF